MQLKSPGQIINGLFQVPDLFWAPAGKGHGIVEHGQQQGFGGMGADDFPLEPGIYEIRYPADVVNVGMGEKEVVYLFGRHRELIKGQFRVAALGIAAVHQDIYAAAGVRVGLNQVTGAGYALFGADVGDLGGH